MGGSCLCKWIVIWKSDNMCCWCNVLLYYMFYGRLCNFHNGLTKLCCVFIDSSLLVCFRGGNVLIVDFGTLRIESELQPKDVSLEVIICGTVFLLQ